MSPTPDSGHAVVAVIDHAAQAVQAPSSDPLFTGLAWVSGILLAVLALAKPFMALARQYRSDSADSARDEADQATFERQTDQIERLSKDVGRLKDERDTWFREATELKSRVERLEGAEESMKRMREKLDEKDLTITELRTAIGERDDKIMSLMQDLIKTNEKLHDLEVRLMYDEHDRCFNCSYKTQTQN